MSDFEHLANAVDLQGRDIVLAADPGRAARFAEVESGLRERIAPGEHVVPMRADLLRVTSR